MLSRRILVGLARATHAPRPRLLQPLAHPRLPLALRQARSYADAIIKVPQMAESISEGTLKQFSKQVGDRVERDEEIATIETDKIDVAVNATEAGVIKELLVKEDDTVTVGQDLVLIEVGAEAEKKASSESEPKPDESKSDESKADQGKPAEPPASGESTQEAPAPAPKEPSPPKPEPKKPDAPKPSQPEPKKPATSEDTAANPPVVGGREERRVKMNRMRLRIAERLKQSQNTTASLTTFQEVDMSSIMEFRKLYKDSVLEKTGVKLGFMSAFAKACVLAMRDVPAVNASIEDGANGPENIVYRDYVDISVAVATKKGLVTPVVRNVESLDMVGIEKAIADLGKKARDDKLTLEDLTGGTFTISNGGVFGSLMGTPIINPPQTAVLGLHAIKERAAVVNGKIEIRPMMYLALTYDHRLLDGREAVTFLVKVKEFIEDPRRMLL